MEGELKFIGCWEALKINYECTEVPSVGGGIIETATRGGEDWIDQGYRTNGSGGYNLHRLQFWF